jgi:iron complex outermembrane receptor protein
MKPTPQRVHRAALHATPIAAAVAVLALGPSASFAQATPAAAPADAPQTVVVTGIRRAIETAIAAKKDADSIVEAITSEDLGKLPEPSVADAMARLPGVAAQRNKNTGKAQSISVRGMSPDFNGALLNGREVASSGDSRGVDFDLYPGELLTSVMIYKTPTSSVVGQGLSSTIDLRTIRPLSASGRQVAANWRDQRTGIGNGIANGEGSGERMSVSYVDQFFNRKLGVALGAVKFRERGAAQVRVNTWGGWTPNLDFNGQQVGVPGGFGRDLEFSDQTREGLMGVLQWRPSKDFETTLDIFQSKGRSANFKKGIEGFIGGGSDAANYRGAPQLVAATVANGFATSGTINNFKGVIRNHNEGTDDELKAFGLNSRLKLGQWTLVGDVAQSKVTREGARFETTAGLPGNGNPNQNDGAPVTPGSTGTISWTNFTGSNHADLVFTSSTNFGDRNVVKLTDVMGWGGGPDSPQAGYVASPKVTDKVDNFRVNAKRDLSWGPVIGIEAGLNHVNREKRSATQEGFLVIAGTTDPFAGLTVPGSTTATVGGFTIATWDPRDSLGSVYSLRSNTYGAVINRNWTVEEKISTGYLKADVDTQVFGRNVVGNLGFQVVRTDQSSSAFVNDSGRCTGSTPDTCVSRSGGTTYTDVLPSINLSMDLGGDMVARLGVGRQLSRANMGQMRASIDQPSIVLEDPTDNSPNARRILTSSGGNPAVKPFRANAFDLSVEKYFGGNKGYISAAAFYKDLSTYILTLPQPYDFTSVVPSNFAFPNGGPVGRLSRPTNGTGGSVKGIELSVNLPLSMIAKPLDGFGFFVNHSDTTSSLSITPNELPGLPPNITFKIPLPGLSRKVTNVRFYYEKHGIQVAVASRTRSDFLGEFKDYKDDGQLAFVRGETVVDAQIGYTFPDRSFLRGLSLLFQANNINNAIFRQYETDRNNPTDTKKFGKTYLMGANYRF